VNDLAFSPALCYGTVEITLKQAYWHAVMHRLRIAMHMLDSMDYAYITIKGQRIYKI